MRQARPTSVPAAVRRLARDGLRIAAVALLALATVLVAGVQTTAVSTLGTTLDEHWRGAYDLLVTAPADQAEQGRMYPPNSLGTTPGTGLTTAQLEQIRAVDGVAVAAPIGQVAMLLFGNSGVDFAVPVAAGVTTPRPRAYRVRARLLTDDGLGPRLVSEQSYDVVVDDADLPARWVVPASDFEPGQYTCELGNGVGYDASDPDSPEICRTRHRTVAMVSRAGEWNRQRWSDAGVVEGYVLFEVIEAPRVVSMLTLVDPVAEAALLGEAGTFLQPLIEQPTQPTLDTLEAWAATATGRRAASLRSALAGVRELEAQWRDIVDRPAMPMLPVVVSAVPQVSLTLELSVEGFGTAELDTNTGPEPGFVLPASLSDGGPGTPLGSLRHDISRLLDPFTRERVAAPWPGTAPDADLPARSAIMTFPVPDAAAPVGAVPAQVTGETTAILTTSQFATTLDRNGMLGPATSVVPTTTDGTRPGAESIYGSLGSGRVLTGALPPLAPIAEFDPAAVTPLTQALSYVPLGGYDPVGSTLVADAAGDPIEPVSLRPTVSGLGLVNQATTMIGSFDAASALLGPAPISAVRVRVAGVEGYSDDSLLRIAQVQRDIEALGLTATLVAGSSPAPMRVTVENYSFGTLDPDGRQRVGTLGVVEQRWSELGAATRIDTVVSRTTTVAVAVSLAACALLLGAVQLIGVPRRRREAAVLSMMGWRRRRIARWYAAEEAVPMLVIAAAGGLAVATARDRPLATVSAGVALGLVGLLAVAAVVATVWDRPVRAATPAARPARGRLPGLGVAAFGARQVLLHPALAASTLLTMATVGVSVTVLGVLVRDEQDDAGASLLAGFVTDRVLAARAALAAVAILAGAGLAVVARRIDARTWAAQAQTLQAMGWTSRERRRARAIEALLIVIPGGTVAAIACWWLTTSLRPGEAGWLAGAGALAALGAGALTFFSTTKDERL